MRGWVGVQNLAFDKIARFLEVQAFAEKIPKNHPRTLPSLGFSHFS